VNEIASRPTNDGNLPACGCGWLLPTDMMVRTPKPEAGDEPVVVVLYCPRCETCFEREMGR